MSTSTRMRFALLAAVVLGGVTGCADFDREETEFCQRNPGRCGADPGPSPDAGTEDAGSPVVLMRYDRHYTSTGIVSRPAADLATAPLELFALDGGTLVRLQGTQEEPGRVRFEVPPGTYYAKSGELYVVTSSRQIDFSTPRFGRPDTRFTDSLSLPARLLVTGASPWNTGYGTTFMSDYLRLVDPNRGEVANLAVFGIASGQTSLMDAEGNYFSSTNLPVSIPEPDKGDQAWLLQRTYLDAGVTSDGGPSLYETSTHGGLVESLASDGGMFEVKATLQPVPQKNVIFEWRRGEFAALSAESGGFSASLFNLFATPHDITLNRFGSLVTFALQDGARSTLVRKLTYGNPFPNTWELVGWTYSSYSTPITSADGMLSTSRQDIFVVQEHLLELTSAPIQPRLSLPRRFLIDGVAASESRTLGVISPMVTWEPPVLGSPSAYNLRIERYPLPGKIGPMEWVADFRLGPSERGVRIPQGVLTSARSYQFKLTVYAEPQTPVESPGYIGSALDHAYSTTSSGILTVP
ncbi:hypothetical protein [Archangium lipolyticum]|uniref:hypothetical protein n=1 Tax=Archangium lipolyticum TaxID=2970465 RepID=UPI00214B194C|nr:hypothetical protein [Archangium lipolyticum]